MIQRNQLVSEFCELVRINSLSLREKALAELLAAKLIDMGLSVEFDNADKALGGQVGNLIARLPATRFGPTLMLQSHMDTVEPGEGIEPVINGNLVCSAGETLGADASRHHRDPQCGAEVIRGIDHGELQIVFCIAEETGLQGAYPLDYSRISPDFAFVFDGGKPAGRMTTAAPSAYKMTFRMKGLAAHAGVHPERGVSAIQAAASGISRMKLGRIDFETTANIGVIEGGQARNIVPDSCTLLAEARSHDDAKLDAQLAHMVMCLEHAAKEAGATFLEPEVATSYRSFRLADDSPIVQIGWRAAEAIGLEPGTEPGGGGSDANVFNEKGIPSVICATGAQGAHTTTETADIDEMLNSANWLVEIIRRA